MSKKDKFTNNTNDNGTNRVFPIKVRLIKPNPANEDKVMFNDIPLYTYKDTEITDMETLMKIQPMQRYLIIKSEIKEAKSEVEETVENIE